MLEKLFFCAVLLIPGITDTVGPEQSKNNDVLCCIEEEKLASAEEDLSLMFAARDEEDSVIAKAEDEEQKLFASLIPENQDEAFAFSNEKLAKRGDEEALFEDKNTRQHFAGKQSDEKDHPLFAHADEQSVIRVLNDEETLV